MSDLTDSTGSGVTDSPAEATPPAFDNAQTDAILALVSPLIEASVVAAVEEARASTPVPTFRPGTCRAVDILSRTCQVLLDGDDETVVGVAPVNAQTIGEHPYVGGRVMVLFSPPSAVYAITVDSTIAPGTIASYAGIITSDTVTSDPTAVDLPPPGWVRPYGQLVNVADYTALYTAIGTTFNTGGETAGLTFRLPDLRGRTVFGADNMGGTDAARLSSSNTIGTTVGAETVTLATGDLPSHSHAAGTLAVSSHTHDLSNHTHSTPNHSHGAGSYAVSSHTHDLGSHTHTVNSHSHGAGSLSTNAQFATGTNLFLHDSGGDSTLITVVVTGSISGSTDSQSPGTSGPSTNLSGSASPGLSGSSANDGSGTSGVPSNNTSGSTAPGLTGSTATTGSGTAVNKMPPGITLHWIMKY